MQTLKLKYHIEQTEGKQLIRQYQLQYSNMLRWMYNRCVEEMSDLDRRHSAKTLNNCDLMNSWFRASCSKDAMAKHAANPDRRVVFGKRKEFIRRCKNLITKEEWQKKKLMPLCSIGEYQFKGNRFFNLLNDVEGVIFKPNRQTCIKLLFDGISKNYLRLLKRLYLLQEAKALPITYYLDSEYVYISFDEIKLRERPIIRKTIENRTMAIDLNPNYIGWSIVDWFSSSEYEIVKTGVYSIKELNDKEFIIKRLPSDDKEKVYLTNKRHHEVMEISKNLINIALYYQCESFICEELKMESSDKEKGKKYNKLVNNLWCRTKLLQNLQKRCNIYSIKFLEIKPNFSSFIGNTLFRKHNLPDMVLASIEIGRRGYEFISQYIKKEKEQKKNIIFPLREDFDEDYLKSLEEFGVEEKSISMKDLYYFLKNAKFRYRVSFEELEPPPKFSRCFSKRSLISKIIV